MMKHVSLAMAIGAVAGDWRADLHHLVTPTNTHNGMTGFNRVSQKKRRIKARRSKK